MIVKIGVRSRGPRTASVSELRTTHVYRSPLECTSQRPNSTHTTHPSKGRCVPHTRRRSMGDSPRISQDRHPKSRRVREGATEPRAVRRPRAAARAPGHRLCHRLCHPAGASAKMAQGACHKAHGTGRMAQGAWHRAHGTGRMAQGACYKAHGTGRMAQGGTPLMRSARGAHLPRHTPRSTCVVRHAPLSTLSPPTMRPAPRHRTTCGDVDGPVTAVSSNDATKPPPPASNGPVAALPVAALPAAAVPLAAAPLAAASCASCGSLQQVRRRGARADAVLLPA